MSTSDSEWAKKYKPIKYYYRHDPEFHKALDEDSIFYKASLENRVWTLERRPGIQLAHPGLQSPYNFQGISLAICEVPYDQGEKVQCVETWTHSVP